MRAIALALVVMVPSASFAHGLGPAEDAPVVERTPSARLLPSNALGPPAVTPEAAAPTYARWWFWTVLSVATVATVVGIVMAGVVYVASLPHVVNTAPPVARCPAGALCSMPE